MAELAVEVDGSLLSNFCRSHAVTVNRAKFVKRKIGRTAWAILRPAS